MKVDHEIVFENIVDMWQLRNLAFQAHQAC